MNEKENRVRISNHSLKKERNKKMEETKNKLLESKYFKFDIKRIKGETTIPTAYGEMTILYLDIGNELYLNVISTHTKILEDNKMSVRIIEKGMDGVPKQYIVSKIIEGELDEDGRIEKLEKTFSSQQVINLFEKSPDFEISTLTNTISAFNAKNYMKKQEEK